MKIIPAILMFLGLETAMAQELRVAAASDLSAAFKEIAAAYQAKTGKVVALSFGSSGNFFAQIQNGAPFDLFFSADMAYPERLQAAGMVEPGTMYQYGEGRLVLWVPKSSSIDVRAMGWNTLRQDSLRKIAIANPQHAPYGRAAVSSLEHEGLYSALKDKLVFGENISQAAQFVQSGNADVGLIALSLALSPSMKDGKYWLVPSDHHAPLRQAAVVLKSSARKDSAAAFMEFMKSAAVRSIMERYGFKIASRR